MRRGPALENSLKTHCPKGHAYCVTNTYHGPDGERHCRLCMRAAQRGRTRRQERADGTAARAAQCARCHRPLVFSTDGNGMVIESCAAGCP